MSETPPQQTDDSRITSEQWQNFVANAQQQNAQLAAQLSATQSALANTNAAISQDKINSLPAEEKAKALENQLAAIRAYGQQAQDQQISSEVWQRRDAEAAARLLLLHGMNGQEASLYKGNWDVNWMPRFVASLDQTVKSRGQQANNNPQGNPANRANVGNGTSNGMPEIDDKASGYDTIRFALSRGNRQ